MNYIYDILINFNEEEIYEFYEWDKNDNIEHVRKIPIFKVRTKDFINIKKNNITVDKAFLNKIRDKTEIFTNTSIDKREYCALITDGMDLIIVEFDENGCSIQKSSMLLDEYEDTLDESDLLDIVDIKFNVTKINNDIEFKTRYQKEIYKYIEKELEKLIEEKSYNKLKYLYYEWYNNKITDMTNIIKRLLDILHMDFSCKHEEFFNLIKLSNMKRQL